MSKWANTKSPVRGGGLASSLRSSNNVSLSALADSEGEEGKSTSYADASPSAMYSWDLSSPATKNSAGQDSSVFLSGSTQSPSSRYMQKSLRAGGIRGKREMFASEHKVSSSAESKGESKSGAQGKCLTLLRLSTGWEPQLVY